MDTNNKLGDTIKAARLHKGLTQAKLARLAGVSRRHLAALEKGANVSVLVLRKVASVLDLTEIELGGVSLIVSSRDNDVNLAVLADTIRDAHAGVSRTDALLTRAERLLDGRPPEESDAEPQAESHSGRTVRFPKPPVVTSLIPQGARERVAEQTESVEKPLEGSIRQGQPLVAAAPNEKALLPASMIDDEELLFRACGDELAVCGIRDGDLLVVEPRRGGKAATGELVIARQGERHWIGRWWQKRDRRAVVSDGLVEIASGRGMKVVGTITVIVRG